MIRKRKELEELSPHGQAGGEHVEGDLMVDDRRLATQFLIGRLVTGAYRLLGDPLARLLRGSADTDPYAIYEDVRARGRLSRTRFGFYATADYELCHEVL